MIFAPFAPIVGASGAVFGIMLAFAKFWPTAQIYIMGILPLEARMRSCSWRPRHCEWHPRSRGSR
jgi:membrane associated rhomboid family serine protease